MNWLEAFQLFFIWLWIFLALGDHRKGELLGVSFYIMAIVCTLLDLAGVIP